MGDFFSSSMNGIPVIDFAPFLAGVAEAQQQVAEQVYQACHEVGFMRVKNLGIPPSLIEATFRTSQELFALPLAVKEQLAWSGAESNVGYVGVGRERLDPAQPGDVKEAFNLAGVNLRDNPWPPLLEDNRATLLAFHHACGSAALHLLRALALGLHLPDRDWFVGHHQQGDQTTLRLLHYPPCPAGQIRAGEHSDYGSLTLLFQDGVGGLEVKNRQGSWISVTPSPDTVVVNLGDLMQRWTNDHLRSTRHRVVQPRDPSQNRDRYSIAFFCDPDRQAEIVCLSQGRGSGHPPRYPMVRAGDYLLSKLQATY
ncbi:MAG: 2-oxoglutarate and iron-dependent oxygenase domain-containing protein [Cyanobacteriota bacterium]|nr:2-oxoglutarate and iron-dependent oxygenase domain-containing protein [Cyanobacteriota bacterium]